MTIRRGQLVALPAAFLFLATPATPASAQDAQVIFERTGYRLTSLGARVAVSARVLDARRRAVPNAPIAWRIQDSAVATVTPRGEVISRRVGRTRLWAVSGADSASALILVDQWAAKFTFNPPVLRFTAIDERRSVQVQARDASGNVIAGMRSALACRIVNEQIASLASNGQVQARASGATYLRCADRGVADSARVEVRQRPVRAMIADKTNFAQRTVGETFQIRMNAVDAEGRPISDARPTWASLDSRVVNIDPLSGRARAVGVGDVSIVAQVGDIIDTLSMNVVAGAGMVLPPTSTETVAAATTSGAAGPRAQLRILAPSFDVGDTASLVEVMVRDTAGLDVDPANVRFRSSDTTVVKYIGGTRLFGVKAGTAYIVARYAGMSDSALVNVRLAGTATSVALAGNSNFVRPSYDTVAANTRSQAQLDSARRAILQASPIRLASGRYVTLSALASQASHASDVSAAVQESRSGLLYGGRATIAPFRKLSVNVDFKTGSLVGDKDVKVEDMKNTEVEGMMVLGPWNAFALRAGYTLRAQSTETAVLQWNFASVGLLMQMHFVGDRLATYAGASLLPMTDLHTDTAKTRRADPTSMSGEAGLEFRTGFFSTSLSYYVERFQFPVENNYQRIDQFSMLRLRVGLQVGR